MNINLPCKETSCDNNTGFQACMFGIDADLIEYAKSNKPMCEQLKNQILELIEVIKE